MSKRLPSLSHYTMARKMLAQNNMLTLDELARMSDGDVYKFIDSEYKMFQNYDEDVDDYEDEIILIPRRNLDKISAIIQILHR